MIPDKNPFLTALKAGNKQIGLWSGLCSGYASEVVAPSGYDWVCIDMEHSPNTIETVLSQLQVFQSTGTTALVRAPSHDPVIVKSLLDIGAPGIVFPMIQNADEARKAVASTQYPPLGVRGVTGMSRANKFGRDKDYFKNSDHSIAVVLQLETEEALNNADVIADTDGVDGIFFGPADIAADMNMLGQTASVEVWSKIMSVARRLISRQINVGTLVMDANKAAELLNDGFSFVACGSDTAILARGADTLLEDVKSRLDR